MLLDNKIFTEKYSQVINKREWVLNRPTRHQAGAFWPKGGFRSLSLKSEFVEKGTVAVSAVDHLFFES